MNEELTYWEIIKKSIKGEETDYTSGNMKKALVMLSIPMIIEMIMEALFAVVDVFFVAKISNEAVATVGLTESVLWILESIAIGMTMAVTALVARRIGEKNTEGASKAAAQALLFGGSIAVILGVTCFIFADDILRFMGGSEELISEGSAYTSIILGFNIVLMLLFLNNAIFRATGNPAVAMRTLWIANGINIILDPCLIFGLLFFPELGLLGAAIASTTGRAIGVLYQFYHLNKSKFNFKIRLNQFLPDYSLIRQIIDLSLGGIGQFLISTASWIFLYRILSSQGDETVAGFTIAIRIIIFTILPSWGLANATSTLVGQNLGAQKADRAEKTVWLASKYNVIFMVFLAIVFYTLAAPIVKIFTQDTAVVSEAVACLKIMCLGYLFFAYNMTIAAALNGAGDTRTPTMINFVSFWLVQIPLAYYLSNRMGSYGVYWSAAISSTIAAILCIVIFRTGKWKTVKV